MNILQYPCWRAAWGQDVVEHAPPCSPMLHHIPAPGCSPWDGGRCITTYRVPAVELGCNPKHLVLVPVMQGQPCLVSKTGSGHRGFTWVAKTSKIDPILLHNSIFWSEDVSAFLALSPVDSLAGTWAWRFTRGESPGPVSVGPRFILHLTSSRWGKGLFPCSMLEQACPSCHLLHHHPTAGA